jgi:hypothetical protein
MSSVNVRNCGYPTFNRIGPNGHRRRYAHPAGVSYALIEAVRLPRGPSDRVVHRSLAGRPRNKQYLPTLTENRLRIEILHPALTVGPQYHNRVPPPRDQCARRRTHVIAARARRVGWHDAPRYRTHEPRAVQGVRHAPRGPRSHGCVQLQDLKRGSGSRPRDHWRRTTRDVDVEIARRRDAQQWGDGKLAAATDAQHQC